MQKVYLRFKNPTVKQVSLIFLLLLLGSCFNEGDCLITSTNLVKIDLLSKVDGSSRLTTFLQVRTDSLEFVAHGDTTVVSLQLPLNPDKLEESFTFLTSDSLTFHLDLKYNTFTRIISSDCGAFLYYDGLSIKETDFNNTKVITTQLLTSVGTNLEVYF
jgi:hypothetical protein